MIERPDADHRRRIRGDEAGVLQADEREQQPDARRRRERSDGGIAIAMRSRSGVTDTSRNSTPAQKMMPSATGHGTPPLMISV